MDNNGRVEAYRRLSVDLRETGLDWVVEEVEGTFVEGHIVEPLEEFSSSARAVRRGSRVSDARRVLPYNPLERLELLVEAIRRAVIVPVKMEREVVSFFEDEALREPEARPVVTLRADDDQSAFRLASVSEAIERGDRADALERALAALLEDARSAS
jgi:hypothetical protein